MSQAREVVSKSGKKLQMEGKCADSSDSVVRLQVPTDLENFWDNAAGIGTDDKTRRSRSPAGSEASTVRHDLASVKVKHAEKLIDRSNSDMEEAFSRLDTFTTDSNKEKNYANEDSLKMKEAFKMQGSEMGDKFGCVSMATNIVRNVVVGGVGFAGHQPSSPPSSDKKSPSPGKPKAEFMPPSIGPSSSYCSVLEDGRSVCVICNKIFSKPSQLRLHVNIHYFERPFRCESCAVSFRTKGHLQKHERSVSHQNKVSMNSTFGTATMTNPRPFKCDDCKIAFRIHGHLAKHLRSKMHIMKLECVGKLPFGTYAEMEREGVSLNDIDTSDCDNSLESLQILAQKLYEKDPSKLGQWDGERGVLMNPNPVLSSGDTSSDEGEPCLSPMNHAPLRLQTSQEELDFKSLSLQSGHVKAENARSPSPLLGGFEYLAGGSHVNAYDPRMRHEQFALGMLPPKVTAFSSKDGRPRIETVTRDVVEEKRRGLGRDRKRKSVDDLDYTDTSDGDNEANSNQKYPCGICFQDFNTQAALHVHSFVEHDSSAAGDEKTPKLCGSPADLRPNDRSRDADSLVTERGCDEGLKQVPKSTSSEGKHWRRAYAPPNVKYVREGDAETDDTDIVGDTKQNPSVK